MPRVAHVKRIHKVVTDLSGAEIMVDNMWIDVLRLDNLAISTQSTDQGIQGQIVNYRFKWNDDPSNPDPNIDASNADIQFENANASRKTEKLLVRDPGVSATATSNGIPSATDIPTMPDDNAVALWIIDRMKLSQPRGGDPAGQMINYVFNNVPLDGSKGIPAERTTSVIKIVNNNLAGLKMNDTDGTPFIRDWNAYRQALQDGQIDPSDPLFLSVEFTDSFTTAFGPSWDRGIIGQIIVYVLSNNTAVENMFQAGDVRAVNADGKSALIRADPLQVIVNIGLADIIAVEFEPGP